ncbi:mucin-5AC isoform X4 [Salmo salar]|uniref:Mucin-5AC isoform X4 n=1 Tax=Salmo salar TaxID=8030 RepID=A0A1S3LTG7_SALSA|nr:mucin-5AC-like isoform X4 [Salmo salar]
MLRRSRISVRPNVRPAGRGPAAPASSQNTPPSSQTTEAPSQAGGQEVDTTTTAEPETSTESTTPREDEKDPNREASSGTPSDSIQRRKRFSFMPNLAKPRAAATPALTLSSPRTSKSPVRAGTETPAPEAPGAPSETDAGPSQGMRYPRRRPSGGSRQAKVQPKPSPLSPSSPAPETTTPPLGKQAVDYSFPSQQTLQAADKEETSSQLTKQDKGSIQLDLSKKTPATKAPSTPLENVPSSSLPHKEGISVSERAKTLVARSVSVGLTGLALGKSRLTRFLNDPTDLQRLAKARKLRELLRQEMNKEKKLRKAKVCLSEYTLDPSKMTMRDLLYYLPDTNPMTSYLEEEQRENQTVLLLTPPREESPARPPTPEAPAETASQWDEDDDDANDGVIVPRVRVAEDGSLIIDEESLTVEVLRQKGPNPADDGDPIFERGSTTTYSSFRKGTHVKPWSNKETDMFFLAINMVGTDFSMIGQLFPHRGRIEIKNKFKKEERANSWRIDKAFKEKRRLDLEFFTGLLEKILGIEAKSNKNNKSPTEKKVIKKNKRKPIEKKAANQLSDVEEERPDAEMDSDEVEGEKENVSNVGTTPAADATTPKRKRKRKDGGESSPKKAMYRKKKKSSNLITSDQEEAGVLQGEVPEDQSPAESSKQAEGPVEGDKGHVEIKPAQLSRGRPQRPLPNLGRKWGQRGLHPKTKPKDKDKDGPTPVEEENIEEGVSKEQVDKAASLKVSQKKKKKAGDVSEEEEEEANDKPIKPTRYGRKPQKTQLLNYPAKEEGDSPSDSAPTPASNGSPSTSSSYTKPKAKPPTRRAKIKPGPALPGRKGQSAARKPKLITLRASQSEDDDDDEEGGREQKEEAQAQGDHHNPTSAREENQAPAFVPMSLRSPQPVVTEVEETMEEDVIDFLSPDNMEVSEESYNEAARTLLAIGNLTHLSQAAVACTAGADDFITEECSNEEQQYQMSSQPADQSQTSTTPSESLTPDLWVTEESLTAEDSVPVATSTASIPVSKISAYVAVAMTTTTSVPVTTTTKIASVPVTTTTASVPVTTTTASVPVTRTTTCITVTTTTASVPITTTTSSVPITMTTASVRVTTSTASAQVPQSSDAPTQGTTPAEEEPLRHGEGTVIGHASHVELCSEVSKQQTTSQTRRSRFPKVKPNLGLAARTTQPKPTHPTENITTQPKPPQYTITQSEPPPQPMMNITASSKPQPTKNITTEPPLPTESITTESEPQPKQRSTTHSKPQRTANIITHREPQPIQRSRVAHSKPQCTQNITTHTEPDQPTLNTTTQSEPHQPTLDTTTQSEPPQPTLDTITNTLSEPQPIPNLEQPGPGTCRTRATVPESPLRSSEEEKGCDGPKEYTSSSLSAVGSQSGTSDSDQPKQTGPPTRRARLPKPKPNLGRTARAATRTSSQVPESRNCPVAQTPDVATRPSSEVQIPHVEATRPSSEVQIPHVEATRPSSEVQIPHVEATRPSSEVQIPHVEATRPSSEVQIPHVEATRPSSEVQRHCTEVQTPEADEVPMEIQQILQVIPLTDIIDVTQEEIQLIHQVTPLTDIIDATQHSESSGSTVLLDPAQPDPDEPIFILSLTEIPFIPTEEEYGCTSQTLSEPLSFLLVADACSQLQQSSDIVDPGGGKEEGYAGMLCKAPEPMSVDEVVPQPMYTSIKEVEYGSTAGPVDVCASANPSEDSMADAETREDIDPPFKRKVPERARRDKLQMRPNTAVRKQPSRSVLAKEAVSASTSDHTTIPEMDHPTASTSDHTTTTIPETDHKTASTSDHTTIPETDHPTASTPDHTTTTIPETDHPTASTSDHTTIPETDHPTASTPDHTTTTPETDHPTASTPDHTTTTIPETDHPTASTSDHTTIPETDHPTASTPDHTTTTPETDHPTASTPDHTTTTIPETDHPTASTSDHTTIPETDHPTASTPDHTTTTPETDHPTASTPDHTTTTIPETDHPTASTSDHTTIPETDHPTASTPDHTTTTPETDHPTASTPDHTTTPESDHPTASTQDHTTTTPETNHPTAPSPPAQPGPAVKETASGEVAAEEAQQEIVGRLDLPETEEDTPTGGHEMEDSRSGAESQVARQMTPLATSGPLSRPGRRPRGFLSFMSNKTSTPAAAPSAPPRGPRAAPQRPQVNTTRPGGKRAAPAPSTRNTTISSTRTVTRPDSSPRVTWEQPSDVQAFHSDPDTSTSQCTTATKPSQVPATQHSMSTCVDSCSAGEEPLNVSQYFFSDIFTEVEESEG